MVREIIEIIKEDGTPLTVSDIQAGKILEMTYKDGKMIIVGIRDQTIKEIIEENTGFIEVEEI